MRTFRDTREKIDDAASSVRETVTAFGVTLREASNTLAVVGVVALAALVLATIALIIGKRS